MITQTAYELGAYRALLKVGLDTTDPDLQRLQALSDQSPLNYVESLFTPAALKKQPADYLPIQQEEQDYLRNTYGIHSRLAGSMPLGLNIPGDIDLDFYSYVPDVSQYRDVISRLNKDPRYVPSPYNVANASFNVFQRPARSADDLPVDVALATGERAGRFEHSLDTREEAASKIPEELKNKIITMKKILKHTPFDAKSKRYKYFKRELDKALGVDPSLLRLQRVPLPAEEKLAAIIDLNDPEQAMQFRQFVASPDFYGHTTHDISKVVDRGRVLSALDALREGALQSYEAGSTRGDRVTVSNQDLPGSVIAELEHRVLHAEPDASAFEDVGARFNMSADATKRNFIRQNFERIKTFLDNHPNAEDFRLRYLSIPKLGPSIFATKGGLLDTPAYGDSSILFKAKEGDIVPSPHMNFVTNEYILPQIKPFESRSIPLSGNYVLAPKEKVMSLEAAHPEYSYVASEDLPEDLRKTLYKPPHDYAQPFTRWVPNLIEGNFNPFETR